MEEETYVTEPNIQYLVTKDDLNDQILGSIKSVPTEMHQIAPSCTKLHRVAEPHCRDYNLT